MENKNDVNFEELLAQYEPTECKIGSVIKARISRIDNEYSFLDLNNKLGGRIRNFEIEGYNVGDEIEVKVIRPEDDFIIVSKIALDRIKELDSLNVGDEVTGTVQKKLKGGYNVKIKSNNAFLPQSLSDSKGKNIVGNTMEFIVKEKSKKGVTLSRVDYTRKQVNDLLNELNEGDIIKVKVSQVLDFGLVVDLGQTTGLIHISEVSWDQINNLADLYKIGDEIEAKLIEVNSEKSKIKLSIKQLTPNPWLLTREKYRIGEKRTGVIKEILDFGLIVDIDETHDEGFMHISDISNRKFFKIDKSYKVGDPIEFIVLNINDEKHRISLSSKQLLDEVWDNIDDILKVGDVVKGHIILMQNYGMFVELPYKLEAFVRKTDYAWNRDEIPELSEGMEIEVMITVIDKEEKKISASLKELVESPWSEVAKEFKVGDVLDTIITDKLENAYLVKLSDRFKGLVPAREVLEEHQVGDVLNLIIIDSNKAKNSFILSSKRLKEKAERDEMNELNGLSLIHI